MLILVVLAKLCSEDRPSGIADWAQYQTAWLVKALGIRYPWMPLPSTYRRILSEVVAVEEFEKRVGHYLSQKVH